MSETKAEGRGDDDQQGVDLRERERETNCERERERETIYQRERDELRQRRKTHKERDDLRTDERRRKMKQRRTYPETTFRFFFTFFFLCLFFTNDPILDRIVFLSLQKRDSYTFLSKKCRIAFLTKIRHMVARFLHLRFHLVEVYDVTPFMDDHPGGDEVLLSATGKDATNDFEDVGHSDSAREMMEKYYIGEIDTSTVPLKRTFIPPQQTPYNQDKTPQFVIKILQFLIPIFILGLAFAVRSYTKEK